MQKIYVLLISYIMLSLNFACKKTSDASFVQLAPEADQVSSKICCRFYNTKGTGFVKLYWAPQNECPFGDSKVPRKYSVVEDSRCELVCCKQTSVNLNYDEYRKTDNEDYLAELHFLKSELPKEHTMRMGECAAKGEKSNNVPGEKWGAKCVASSAVASPAAAPSPSGDGTDESDGSEKE